MNELVVKGHFTHNGIDYSRGQEILDPDLIAELKEKFPHQVVSRAVPAAPAMKISTEADE